MNTFNVKLNRNQESLDLRKSKAKIDDHYIANRLSKLRGVTEIVMTPEQQNQLHRSRRANRNWYNAQTRPTEAFSILLRIAA